MLLYSSTYPNSSTQIPDIFLNTPSFLTIKMSLIGNLLTGNINRPSRRGLVVDLTEDMGLAAAGFSLAQILGCASASPINPRSQIHHLERDTNYLVLINFGHTFIDDISGMVRLEGRYDHVELIRNGRAYGSRPPKASEISTAQLENIFRNCPYEIRKVQINGDPERAIRWFRQRVEGRPYHVYGTDNLNSNEPLNCTDCVVGMYAASGDRTRRLHPFDVQRTIRDNRGLRRYMTDRGLPNPTRQWIYLPDQFRDVGTLVDRGVFGR